MKNKWEQERDKIIGLGENSFKKSYYPEFQAKLNELEASYNNLHTVFDSTGDAIIVHNINGQILYVNKPGKKLIKLIDGNADCGNYLKILLDYSNVSTFIEEWQKVMKSEPTVMDIEIVPQNNSFSIHLQTSINKVKWFGEPALIEIIRDFSDRIEYEKQLKQAKERAEESDRLKTAFLANLSHEIRTPMNGILGFTDLLLNEATSEEEREHCLKIIQSSGERLLNLINELIDISKIETGTAEVYYNRTNLNNLLSNIYNFYKPQVESKKLHFSFSTFLPDASSDILTDSLRLEQILSNLIYNAIKFTNSGYINFGYKIVKRDIHFWVKDSGIGISKEDQEVIFNRFRKISNSTTNNLGGSGLGLSIVKAFVELLGGTISVISEPNQGAAFQFIIPFRPVDNTQSDVSTRI
jgi:signal transduction histidine kinase